LDRAEFEVRLLNDGEFRGRLLEAQDARRKLDQAREELKLVRAHFHIRVRELVEDLGLPAASVARWVGVPAPTVQLILKKEGSVAPDA
jgi:hypothetical protein